MKKVININFQGQVIAIEEDAYEILKQYIDSLQAYFSREEGGDEIVNDIESRIAELFGNRLKHGIPCITDQDVASIIASIGRPSDFDADYETPGASDPHIAAETASTDRAGSAPSTGKRQRLYRNSSDEIIGGVCGGLAHYLKTDPVWIRLIFVLLFGLLFWVYVVMWIILPSKPLESNVTKRFYRNPGDKIIGGVCGGLAAYFKIDSWIPRLIFLLPILFNTIGMVSIFPMNWLFERVDLDWNINFSTALVYLILWIIIPQAKTVKQKLEMMGEEEYIQSIRNRVSDNVSGSKTRAEEGSPVAYAPVNRAAVTEEHPVSVPPRENVPPVPPPVPASERPPYPAEPPRSGCLNALVVLLNIVFFTFVGFLGLTLLSIFIGFLFTGAHLMPLKSLFIDSGLETNLLIIAFCLLVLVPVIAIVTWIIRRVIKAKSRPVIGVIVLVLWMGGLVTSGILAYRLVNKYNVESTSEKVVPLTPVTSNKLYVEMQPYHDDYAEITSSLSLTRRGRFMWDQDFHEWITLPYSTVNEDSLLYDQVHLSISNSSDSLFHVRTIASCLGRNLRSAKADIERFRFTVQQNDSVLYLPQFLAVPIEQGFRNQRITVEIAVPAGKSVEVSDELNSRRIYSK